MKYGGQIIRFQNFLLDRFGIKIISKIFSNSFLTKMHNAVNVKNEHILL